MKNVNLVTGYIMKNVNLTTLDISVLNLLN